MFIVIEGLDGSGKSEVSKLVAQDIGAHLYKNPPKEYKLIRSYVNCSGNKYAQFYYYLSSNFLASTEIKNILNEGQSVVSDRYYYSTLTYFSDLPESKTVDLRNFLQPDVAFLLSVEDESIRRKRILSRAVLGWSDIMCLDDDDARSRITSAYEKLDLIKIETSTLNVAEVVDKILHYIYNR